MTLEVFYSRAGHLIRRMNQIAVAIFLEETSELGLTTVQYAALHMIDEIPNVDQASLSSMIAFDKTTIVKVLDRLEEKGLITRERSETDRRRQLLNATKRGQEVVRQIEPMINRCEERILAPLSAPDKRRFMEMLTQIVRVNNTFSRAPLNDELLEDFAARKNISRPKKPIDVKVAKPSKTSRKRDASGGA